RVVLARKDRDVGRWHRRRQEGSEDRQSRHWLLPSPGTVRTKCESHPYKPRSPRGGTNRPHDPEARPDTARSPIACTLPHRTRETPIRSTERTAHKRPPRDRRAGGTACERPPTRRPFRLRRELQQEEARDASARARQCPGHAES